MKRALILTGSLVLALLASVFVLALLALAEPGWLLNTRTASSAIRSFGKSYRPRWTGLGLDVVSAGLRTKHVAFHAEDFCVDEKRGAVKGCFAALRLDATLRLGFSPPVRILRLETFVVRAGPVLTIRVSPPPAAPAAERKRRSAPAAALIPSALSGMTAGLIDIRVPRAELVSSSGTTTLALDAGFSAAKNTPLTAELFAVVPGSAPSAVSRYHASLKLDSGLLSGGIVSPLDARATLRGEGIDAEFDAALRTPRPGELAATANAVARASGRIVRARIEGLYTTRRASATATISVEDPRGPIRRAALEDCRFDSPLGKDGPESADLKCAIRAAPKAFGLKKPESDIAGTLGFHVDFLRRRARADRFTAQLEADLSPGKSWYALDGHLAVELAGKTRDWRRSLTAKYEARAGVTIARFQDLMEALAGTELAIPAPLNALDGRVSFEAHAAGDAGARAQIVDYSGGTSLKSKKERLITDVTGRLTIADLAPAARRVKDETNVRLKDVALELPYLKLGPVPTPISDSRIKTGGARRAPGAIASRPAPKTSTSSSVDYDVRIRTDKPALLATNLNKDPIPISLDLRAVPAGGSGQVRVEPFDVKLFRQTAKVDHITLDLKPGASDAAIDGKIVYKRLGAVIDILILGSVQTPTVAFESTPPMTENEIVSLLLYGKDPAELDSDQSTSAGAAAAGFSSGAFGLGSLFLFGSTPVDSVSYDPASQTYEVKFKLPGGATFGVGSNMEESRTLTLRRRVARNVDVETEYQQNDPLANGRNDVTTFLEWFQRY